jgi:hypothetical protein
MKKIILIEKKKKENAGEEALKLSDVEVVVLGVYDNEKDLRIDLNVMKNLQKAGKLDPKMSMDIIEVELDGQA